MRVSQACQQKAIDSTVRYPWHTDPPSGGVHLEDPEDTYVTIDRWDPCAFQWHYHTSFNWLVVMDNGWLEVEVADRRVTITEKKWIMVLPHVLHKVSACSPGVEALSLFFSQADMFHAWQALDEEWSLSAPYFLGCKETIAKGLALQWSELRHNQLSMPSLLLPFRDFLCRWLWQTRGCLTQDDNVIGFIRDGAPFGDALEALFHQFLDEKPFPWERVARKLAVSPRSLQRKISAHYNTTPSGLLMHYRIERAGQLLSGTNLPLVDIALNCGFASQAHFSTSFKAATQQAPSTYRKQRTPEVREQGSKN